MRNERKEMVHFEWQLFRFQGINSNHFYMQYRSNAETRFWLGSMVCWICSTPNIAGQEVALEQILGALRPHNWQSACHALNGSSIYRKLHVNHHLSGAGKWHVWSACIFTILFFEYCVWFCLRCTLHRIMIIITMFFATQTTTTTMATEAVKNRRRIAFMRSAVCLSSHSAIHLYPLHCY